MVPLKNDLCGDAFVDVCHLARSFVFVGVCWRSLVFVGVCSWVIPGHRARWNTEWRWIDGESEEKSEGRVGGKSRVVVALVVRWKVGVSSGWCLLFGSRAMIFCAGNGFGRKSFSGRFL